MSRDRVQWKVTQPPSVSLKNRVVVVSNIFEMFTPNLGEDDPI